MSFHIANLLLASQGIDLNTIPGFEVFQIPDTLSELPLLTLQADVPLLSWNTPSLFSFPFDDEEVLCDFSCNDATYLFRMTPAQGAPCLMEITPQADGFLALTNMNGQTPVFLLRFACWMAFGIAALHRHTVALHASTINYAGKAVLFLGESGTGKSTHTRLWLRHIPNAGLLNDDSPFVQIKDDGVLVYGSPWSGKTPCFKNIYMPIAAMVRLSQAPYNEITRLKGIRALGALLPSCPPAFAYHTHLAGLMHEFLSVILQHTPVYHLACLPNAEAAELVVATLKKDGNL